MSLLSRSVPIRYERDFWPTTYDRRMPIYRDPVGSYQYSYSTNRESGIPYEYDRPLTLERPFIERPIIERPIIERPLTTPYDGEMARMSDEMRRMCDTMSRSMITPTTTMAPAIAPAPFTHTPVPILPTVDDWRLTENFRMDNPIISERDGSRKFYLEFDVSQFKPEEITVKTTGNQISVHARHDDKDPNRSSHREFSRQYNLPKEVRPELLMSKLSERGKLTIEAPLPALPGGRDKLIPIEHRK